MFSKYATKDADLEKLLDELVSVHCEYTQKTQEIIMKIKNYKMSDKDLMIYESDLMRKNTHVPLYEILHPRHIVRSDSKIRNRGVSDPIKICEASMISHV